MMPKHDIGIGLGQARLLCQMKHERRLDFIAEGLPLILASSHELWTASQQLKDADRSANILEGHAQEEASKILILLDIVRCPRKLVGARIGSIVKWFYDHLSRLIYAKAVSWSAPTIGELRTYVDDARKAHYVEGDFGEYIMPNDELYGRESNLYVDIERQADGHQDWSAPRGFARLHSFGDAPVLRIVDALSALGITTSKGLRATADVFGAVDFVDERHFLEYAKLIEALLERVCNEGLFTEAAEDKHLRAVRGMWQMPMYNIDLSILPVPLNELQQERDNILFSQIGDSGW